MSKPQLLRAVDGAHAVTVSDDGVRMVVWSGGVTFNVYRAMWYDADGVSIEEVTCFTVSDEVGEPLDRGDAVEHMQDWLDTETDP